MASLETITPVVAQRLYGWGPCLHPADCAFRAPQTYTNLLLTAGGLLSLAMAALMSIFGAKPLDVTFFPSPFLGDLELSRPRGMRKIKRK